MILKVHIPPLDMGLRRIRHEASKQGKTPTTGSADTMISEEAIWSKIHINDGEDRMACRMNILLGLYDALALRYHIFGIMGAARLALGVGSR